MPGRVTAFVNSLRDAIGRYAIMSEDSDIHMDIEPDKVIGTASWQDKITHYLQWANVFVSIMTAHYLQPTTNGTGCQWELGIYRDLALGGDEQPHTLITLRLCQDIFSDPILERDPWSFLKTQEIIGYDQCDPAWNQGLGMPDWEKLVSDVAKAIIGFCMKQPAQTGPINLDTVPIVGLPVSWSSQEPPDPRVKCQSQWILDGVPVQDATTAYIPQSDDVGKKLSAQSTFETIGSHTVTRRTQPATVLSDTSETAKTNKEPQRPSPPSNHDSQSTKDRPETRPKEESRSHHDFYICYSDKDEHAATAVCHTMERNGMRCWIQSRDVTPEEHYITQIKTAIRHCRVFVLFFSAAADTSAVVNHEVRLAVQNGKTVVVLRTDRTKQLNPELSDLLKGARWLDAYSGNQGISQLLSILVGTSLRLAAASFPRTLPA